MAITRDGNTLASGQITHMGYLAEIILWDISGLHKEVPSPPELIVRLKLHKVMVQALDFSCNGQFLASIGGPDDNNLVIWNVATAQAICGSPAAHDSCLTVKWMNNDPQKLVTGGLKALRMWSLDTEGRKVRPMEVSTSKEVRTYTCVAISDDDAILYCGTTTGDGAHPVISKPKRVPAEPRPTALALGSWLFFSDRVCDARMSPCATVRIAVASPIGRPRPPPGGCKPWPVGARRLPSDHLLDVPDCSPDRSALVRVCCLRSPRNLVRKEAADHLGATQGEDAALWRSGHLRRQAHGWHG